MLTEFNRLLPEDGVTIYPNITYRDVNDIGVDIRGYVKEFFDNDKEYQSMRDRYSKFKKTRSLDSNTSPSVRRRYCVYVFRDSDIICNLICKEALVTPYGFGEDDFLYTKRVFPEYRHTKYSRYASGDFIHMMFKSGMAKRLYSYMFVVPGAIGDNPWEVVDRTVPCAGILYQSDSPKVQKYICIRCRVDDIIVLEYDGEIYNSMNLKEYFMAPGNRTEEMADRWIEEMDRAADVVRRTAR